MRSASRFVNSRRNMSLERRRRDSCQPWFLKSSCSAAMKSRRMESNLGSQGADRSLSIMFFAPREASAKSWPRWEAYSAIQNSTAGPANGLSSATACHVAAASSIMFSMSTSFRVAMPICSNWRLGAALAALVMGRRVQEDDAGADEQLQGGGDFRLLVKLDQALENERPERVQGELDLRSAGFFRGEDDHAREVAGVGVDG